MDVKIQLNGVKVKDEAKILTGAKIRGNGKCNIQAENIEISGNAELLTDMELEEVMEKAKAALQELDPSSTEYTSLNQIIQEGRSENKRDILRKIGMHIGIFTEGVLQNVIADIVSGRSK